MLELTEPRLTRAVACSIGIAEEVVRRLWRASREGRDAAIRCPPVVEVFVADA